MYEVDFGLFSIDLNSVLLISIIWLLAFISYLLIRKQRMSATASLNSAVNTLDAAASSLVTAVDGYLAARADATANMTPDVEVQAAADKIIAIASALQAQVEKVKV